MITVQVNEQIYTYIDQHLHAQYHLQGVVFQK